MGKERVTAIELNLPLLLRSIFHYNLQNQLELQITKSLHSLQVLQFLILSLQETAQATKATLNTAQNTARQTAGMAQQRNTEHLHTLTDF